MNRKDFRDTSWFPFTISLCVAVILYIALSRVNGIWSHIRTFIGYFRPLIYGCVLAYIVNPLSVFFKKHVFRKVKKEERGWVLSNICALVAVLLLLSFALSMLIPQIISSIVTFSQNLDGYVKSLNRLVDSLGISSDYLNLDSLIDLSENLLNRVVDYLQKNINNILSASVSAGKAVFQWVVAFILSVYLLFGKEKLKKGVIRLIRAVFGDKRADGIFSLLGRCNEICNRYVVYNILDAILVGALNAIFMTVTGMQYAGLVSIVVALTNLIPTFGPIIGGVTGAFILVMVKPVHALIFLIFTLVLQFCDGYIIKPRLFGNSLGVSGLWILVAILAGGSMFGIAGILLAIPAVAIIDLLYGEYLLPWLEARRERTNDRDDLNTDNTSQEVSHEDNQH